VTRPYTRSGLATRAGRSLARREITLQQVADHAGVSVVSVHHVLAGRNRSKKIEVVIVELLGLKSGRDLFEVTSA